MALPKVAKIFLWLFGIGVILIGVVVFVITMSLGKIVTAGVNKFGPQITGTEVELASADISLFGGSGTLNGLRIGNPEGWGEGDLATLERIHLDLDPWSLFGETIVIEDIDIQAPTFRYVSQGGTSNVDVMLGAINEALGAMESGETDPSPPPAEEETAPEAAAGETLISVGHFGLRGANVNVVVGDRSVDATMPDIDMTNLGTPEQGLTPSELTFKISGRVLTEITKAAAKTMVQNKLEETVGGKIRGLLGGGD